MTGRELYHQPEDFVMNVQDYPFPWRRAFRDHDLHAGTVSDHGELDAMLR
ncbi:MAG: hypothetical protein M3440_00745 [Chloroflexota bacterium]|nr:hypothetical protein [Chloroflexota bacterium]